MRVVRDPMIRNGAFILEGTRLSITDLLFSLKREDLQELDIKEDALEATRKWLLETFEKKAPAYVKNCLAHSLREIKPHSKCIGWLIKRVRFLELLKRLIELLELQTLLEGRKIPEEKSILAKWYRRFEEFSHGKEAEELLEEEILKTIKELYGLDRSGLKEELKLLELSVHLRRFLRKRFEEFSKGRGAEDFPEEENFKVIIKDELDKLVRLYAW